MRKDDFDKLMAGANTMPWPMLKATPVAASPIPSR